MRITAFNTNVPYADLLWSRWAVQKVASLANIVLWSVQQMLSNESLASRLSELSPRNWSWMTDERQKAILEHVSSDQWQALIVDNPAYFDRILGWDKISEDGLVYLMHKCPQIFADFADKLTESQSEFLVDQDLFHKTFALDIHLIVAQKVRSSFLKPLWDGYIAQSFRAPLNKEMIDKLVQSKRAQVLLNALVAEGDLEVALCILERTRGDISYKGISYERLFNLLNSGTQSICWETLLPLAAEVSKPEHCFLILRNCPLDLSEALLNELSQSLTVAPWHRFLQKLTKKGVEDPRLERFVGEYLGMQKAAWSEYIRLEKSWPKRLEVSPHIDSWDEVKAWEKMTGSAFKIEWLQNTLPSIQQFWARQASEEELLEALKHFQKSTLAFVVLLELMSRKEDLSTLTDLADMCQEEPLAFALGWLLNKTSSPATQSRYVDPAPIWFWEGFLMRLPKKKRQHVNLSHVKEISRGRILLEAAEGIWSQEDFAGEALRILNQDWNGQDDELIHDLESLTLKVKEKDRLAFFKQIQEGDFPKERMESIQAYYENSTFEAKEIMLQFASR